MNVNILTMLEIIAHRGASKLAPENTLKAIDKAIQYAVDYIEVDVHISKDGVPVVIHDANLARTTNCKTGKRITDLTLDEIKALDAGSWFGPDFTGETIPTLEEVLKLPRGSIGLMIEVKKGQTPAKVAAASVCELLRRYPQNSPLAIGSFSPHILDAVKERMPEVSLIGIAEDFNMIAALRGMKLARLALWYKLLSPELVRSLHEEGSQVWTFTVDDERTARFLASIQVDGIITNDCPLMQLNLGLRP